MLEELWLMTCGRRRSLRVLAIDAANCAGAMTKKDWPLFLRTGDFRNARRRPPDPCVQEALDRITANGGRL